MQNLIFLAGPNDLKSSQSPGWLWLISPISQNPYESRFLSLPKRVSASSEKFFSPHWCVLFAGVMVLTLKLQLLSLICSLPICGRHGAWGWWGPSWVIAGPPPKRLSVLQGKNMGWGFCEKVLNLPYVPEGAARDPGLKGLVPVCQARGPRKFIISTGEENVQIHG